MVDASKLRAWYAHRQGLDGSLKGASPAEVFKRAGWARSVGGVGPYLTLFSRAGVSREQADAAAARLEIYELPSARGCTYVLPASDFALGLTVGLSFAGEIKTAQKLGVTIKEIEKLCDAVLSALEKGPLEPGRIAPGSGQGGSQSRARKARRRVSATTLPVALEQLQARGEIRRIPANGRFDQQRYQYALWRPSPLREFKLTPEESYSQLARRFFTWIAPASVAEFQWFSGLGVKAAKAAVEPLKLEPLAPGDERMFLPGDRARFRSLPTAQRSTVRLDWRNRFTVPAAARPEEFARSERPRPRGADGKRGEASRGAG